MADLLSVNLRAPEQEPQMFLDGMLVVSSSKRRQVEKKTFWLGPTRSLFFRGCCALFMLIVGQTCPSISCLSFIRHFSGSAWLKYDLTFRKDAAVSGLSDWSRMNLDLYNFHLRSPAMASPPLPRSSSSTESVTPAWSLLFAIHGTTCSAAGLLAGANIDTTAVTVKVITPEPTVHFRIPLARYWMDGYARLGLCT